MVFAKPLLLQWNSLSCRLAPTDLGFNSRNFSLPLQYATFYHSKRHWTRIAAITQVFEADISLSFDSWTFQFFKHGWVYSTMNNYTPRRTRRKIVTSIGDRWSTAGCRRVFSLCSSDLCRLEWNLCRCISSRQLRVLGDGRSGWLEGG